MHIICPQVFCVSHIAIVLIIAGLLGIAHLDLQNQALLDSEYFTLVAEAAKQVPNK